MWFHKIVLKSDKEAQPSYTTLGPGASTQFADAPLPLYSPDSGAPLPRSPVT